MKVVVLAIDMVRGFYDTGNLKNPRMGNIIPNIGRLMERTQKNEDNKILFICDNHCDDDPEFKIFPKHCITGTEEIEIVPQLRNFLMWNRINYTPKTKFNALYKTHIEELLAHLEPDVIIVVGVCTDICILYTVAGLRDLDYKVIVPKDCVETYDAPGHNAEEINAYILKHMEEIRGAIIIDKQENIDLETI